MQRLPAALLAALVLAVGFVGGGQYKPARPWVVPLTPGASTFTEWHGYHYDAAHSGYNPNIPAAGALSRAWTARLDGVVQASPLVARGVVIAATENNTMYGLSPSTGRVIWSRHLAPPVTSGLPCGNINPLGITGTPVYDSYTNRVFAVTTTPNGSSITHTLVGLNPTTGQQTFARNIDIPGQSPLVENQRGALSLSKGRVLVAYGGHAGDCGNYHGYLVSVTVTNGTGFAYYRAGTGTEAGMWQPSGTSVDRSGYAYNVTGNGSQTSGSWDGGNAVNKFDPVTMRRLSSFAPTDWASGNQSDSDLGSAGAALVGGYIWTQGKTSTGYVLRQSNLGGVGGQVSTASGACATQFGGPAVHSTSIYAPCTNGVRHIVIGTDGIVHAGWRAPSNVTGSPVVGGQRVWALDPGGGTLYAMNEQTGAVAASISVGTCVRFATPALTGRLVLVPTQTGITAVNGA
jgi:outer membrane protein assembly factor BamB